MLDPVVIVATARTPIGTLQGALATLSAAALGGAAIKGALDRAALAPEAIQEVIMGNVLSAGQGQAPARQAALRAGLPLATGCTTINKMCGSGMKAVMLARDLLVAGTNDAIVAGGMESMTNAPYLLMHARTGLRAGHHAVKDHMFLDGLEDAYECGRLMGSFAEDCATRFGFTREAQDRFAMISLARAQAAVADGTFEQEIVPVPLDGNSIEKKVHQDEQPLTARVDKIPLLRPAFRENGSVTPGNSSSISDGAAALVLARRSVADKHGLNWLATIVGHATHAQEPAWFTTAPVGATKKLFQKTGWDKKDVDLFEINEAFAVVVMAAMHELDLPHEKVNVHGGACALGHPLGATGARIIVTLLTALEKYDLRRGVASLCIGGGEATAIAIERVKQ